jgi:hypothetical protein
VSARLSVRLSGSSRKSPSTYFLLTCTAITTYPPAEFFQEYFQFISGLNLGDEVHLLALTGRIPMCQSGAPF